MDIDWRDELRQIDRYKDFTLLDPAQSFKVMFKGKTIPLVQVHSLISCGGDIVGFCGVFRWDNDILTPLDGDSYNDKMMVYGYKWFKNPDTQEECLDVLVNDDW